jgi:hypothetical protein
MGGCETDRLWYCLVREMYIRMVFSVRHASTCLRRQVGGSGGAHAASLLPRVHPMNGLHTPGLGRSLVCGRSELYGLRNPNVFTSSLLPLASQRWPGKRGYLFIIIWPKPV